MNIDWPEAKIFNTKNYKRARFEGHNALFWLARGAHSFLVPCDNDTHLDLSWHEKPKVFGPNFDRDLQIGLIADLELYFAKMTSVPRSFWMDDRTSEAWDQWSLSIATVTSDLPLVLQFVNGSAETIMLQFLKKN